MPVHVMGGTGCALLDAGPRAIGGEPSQLHAWPHPRPLTYWHVALLKLYEELRPQRLAASTQGSMTLWPAVCLVHVPACASGAPARCCCRASLRCTQLASLAGAHVPLTGARSAAALPAPVQPGSASAPPTQLCGLLGSGKSQTRQLTRALIEAHGAIALTSARHIGKISLRMSISFYFSVPAHAYRVRTHCASDTSLHETLAHVPR